MQTEGVLLPVAVISLMNVGPSRVRLLDPDPSHRAYCRHVLTSRGVDERCRPMAESGGHPHLA